ncbi:hypothetical protein BGZ65_003396 [Modicella reniformis]|uniref:Uncharacterized protein n=1 Tax=Modicella reniformis TaxID=1440133 RepID=A0A9P6J6K3_9FUNG|nr:hypothetical protein BGZ65_003396 [Modicella reniformis]
MLGHHHQAAVCFGLAMIENKNVITTTAGATIPWQSRDMKAITKDNAMPAVEKAWEGWVISLKVSNQNIIGGTAVGSHHQINGSVICVNTWPAVRAGRAVMSRDGNPVAPRSFGLLLINFCPFGLPHAYVFDT